jgi:hypothetical protein
MSEGFMNDHGMKDDEQKENPYRAMIAAMNEFNQGTNFDWSGWTARLE